MRIEFSKYNLKIHSKNDQLFIFDEVRKKNVILTPEEWVRQHFIHFFIQDLSYPKGKIAIEALSFFHPTFAQGGLPGHGGWIFAGFFIVL